KVTGFHLRQVAVLFLIDLIQSSGVCRRQREIQEFVHTVRHIGFDRRGAWRTRWTHAGDNAAASLAAIFHVDPNPPSPPGRRRRFWGPGGTWPHRQGIIASMNHGPVLTTDQEFSTPERLINRLKRNCSGRKRGYTVQSVATQGIKCTLLEEALSKEVLGPR